MSFWVFCDFNSETIEVKYMKPSLQWFPSGNFVPETTLWKTINYTGDKVFGNDQLTPWDNLHTYLQAVRQLRNELSLKKLETFCAFLQSVCFQIFPVRKRIFCGRFGESVKMHCCKLFYHSSTLHNAGWLDATAKIVLTYSTNLLVSFPERSISSWIWSLLFL